MNPIKDSVQFAAIFMTWLYQYADNQSVPSRFVSQIVLYLSIKVRRDFIFDLISKATAW